MQDLKLRVRAAKADIHFKQIAAGVLPVDYDLVGLIGEEKEPTLSPRVLAVFYVGEENCRAIDMITVISGGSGEEFLKTELGLVESMRIESERLEHQVGEPHPTLREFLEADSGDLGRARKLVQETNLPLFLVVVGRRMPDLEPVAVMWQLPFLESNSLLEKIKERLGVYMQ